MQSSVNQEVLDAKKDLFENRKYRYLIITYDAGEYAVEKAGARDATWEQFKEDMPKEHPRYVIYDLDVNYKDGRKDNKVVFVAYSPDDCPVFKEKISYSQNKDKFVEKIRPFA